MFTEDHACVFSPADQSDRSVFVVLDWPLFENGSHASLMKRIDMVTQNDMGMVTTTDSHNHDMKDIAYLSRANK